MTQKDLFIGALRDGDLGALTESCPDGVSPEIWEDDGVRWAFRRAVERVVFHRPDYRKILQIVTEWGAPFDIWSAARAGFVNLVQGFLVDDPSLLDGLDSLNRTPLQRAALVYGICRESEEVADFLIAEGATVDVFSAATFCLHEVLRDQLERDGGLANARCQGASVLNWAVRPRRNYSHAAVICSALLAADASVEDRDEEESGMMPLHHAAEWGPAVCVELVDLLLEAGADINCTDDNGWTPLDFAIDRRRDQMVDCLIARGAKANNNQA